MNGRTETQSETSKITTPTLHLHGLKDGNLENGRKMLSTCYDAKTAKLMEIDYHHAMPWNKADVDGFVNAILELSGSVR